MKDWTLFVAREIEIKDGLPSKGLYFQPESDDFASKFVIFMK